MSEPAGGGEALQPTVVTSSEIEDAKRLLESSGMTVTTPEELAAAQAAAAMVDREAFVASSIAYYERENSTLAERRVALEAKLEREKISTAATEQALLELDAEIQQNEDAAQALRSEGGV
jgi:hypothetical protein